MYTYHFPLLAPRALYTCNPPPAPSPCRAGAVVADTHETQVATCKRRLLCAKSLNKMSCLQALLSVSTFAATSHIRAHARFLATFSRVLATFSRSRALTLAGLDLEEPLPLL